MKITNKDIDYIAHLARLNLSATEQKEMGDNLEKILEYMNKLNEIDTESVEATAHVLSINNILRNDKKQAPSISRDEILNNAPAATLDGFFKVPKIIE